MRYYRTKDRIYDGSLYLKEYTGWYFHEKSKLYVFTESEIIKQANTVEELCDRFVLAGIDIIILNKEHTQYRFEDDNPYLDEYDWFDITETELKRGIGGAIWTDKGLTYVTKPMTKEGKFELL